jgi:hypothetical protein
MPRPLLACAFASRTAAVSGYFRRMARDEVEGLFLSAGGLGEDGDGGGGAGEAELVAGEGGEVVQQALVAEVGAAVLVPAGGFGLGGCRAPGGCHGFA